MKLFRVYRNSQGSCPEICWFRICLNSGLFKDGYSIFFIVPLISISEKVFDIFDDQFKDYWYVAPYFNIRWKKGEISIYYGLIPIKEVFVSKRIYNIYEDREEVL